MDGRWMTIGIVMAVKALVAPAREDEWVSAPVTQETDDYRMGAVARYVGVDVIL